MVKCTVQVYSIMHLHVMFVYFIVCLFANNDGWKCFFKKSPLRLVGSPCPWLVFGLLSSLVYGNTVMCTLYSVM